MVLVDAEQLMWGNLWFLGAASLTGPKESDGDTRRAMLPKLGKRGCSQQGRLGELCGMIADNGEREVVRGQIRQSQQAQVW